MLCLIHSEISEAMEGHRKNLMDIQDPLTASIKSMARLRLETEKNKVYQQFLQYEDVWFATVGNQLVSDGVYKTKEELTKSLEKLNLETICKIIAGAFGRAIELKTEKQ